MQELYDNLMALVVPGDYTKFYYKDFLTVLQTRVRVFTYNYAQYSDWCQPDALECRGIMFEMDENDKPVRIMCRPMEKFFNLGECPFTMGLDLDQIDYSMTKADGSLISTFVDKGMVYCKSKGSIWSEQAVAANAYLLDYYHKGLYDRVLELANEGWTCNFEYVAPTNRVVVAYQEPRLILLNVRNNETGEYAPIKELQRDAVLRFYLVDVYVPEEYSDNQKMIDGLREEVGTEGMVFVMPGLRFKVKTNWYSALHRVKDTLSNNRDLFETVVSGGSDDLKGLFDDNWSRTKIETFEGVFYKYLRDSIDLLNEFYNKNRGAERKNYAIDAQTYFRSKNKFELFGISMLQYQGNAGQEKLVELVNEVFLKNRDAYIPKEYATTKVNDG